MFHMLYVYRVSALIPDRNLNLGLKRKDFAQSFILRLHFEFPLGVASLNINFLKLKLSSATAIHYRIFF